MSNERWLGSIAQEAIMTRMGAGRVIRQLRNVVFPLALGEGVRGGADSLDSYIDVEVPDLDGAVGDSGG
jgi:hypothetical protein